MAIVIYHKEIKLTQIALKLTKNENAYSVMLVSISVMVSVKRLINFVNHIKNQMVVVLVVILDIN